MPWCPVSNSGWSVEQNRLPRHTCHSLLKPLIDCGLRAPREFLPVRVRAYLYWLQVIRTKFGLINGQALWLMICKPRILSLGICGQFFCRKMLLLFLLIWMVVEIVVVESLMFAPTVFENIVSNSFLLKLAAQCQTRAKKIFAGLYLT